jgi:hypothetical protein
MKTSSWLYYISSAFRLHGSSSVNVNEITGSSICARRCLSLPNKSPDA